jgi:hypothetical protein
MLAALLIGSLAVASTQFTKGKNCFPTCARAARARFVLSPFV